MGLLTLSYFLILKKAFNTVDHQILLSKLSIYGLNENALDWFASYLKTRNQKCIVNGHLSYSRSLTFGIPQGTTHGPLVFLWRRQRGLVVRVGDLNTEDPGSNPRLGLLNGFVLGDPRGKFTTLCK